VRWHSQLLHCGLPRRC